MIARQDGPKRAIGQDTVASTGEIPRRKERDTGADEVKGGCRRLALSFVS